VRSRESSALLPGYFPTSRREGSRYSPNQVHKMDNKINTTVFPFAPLNENNYGTWHKDMGASLKQKGLYRLVIGEEEKPNKVIEPTAYKEWIKDFDKAAGYIWNVIESAQKEQVASVYDDPVAMWNKLKEAYVQKIPGTRFTAFSNLFSIRKEGDESLQSLMTHTSAAMTTIKALLPENYSLEQMQQELEVMTLIHALPRPEYSSFASNLLLRENLDKKTISHAFIVEEAARKHEAEIALKVQQANAVAAVSERITKKWCPIHKSDKHDLSECYEVKKLLEERKSKQTSKGSNFSKRSEKAQTTQEAENSEYAGTASCLSTTEGNPDLRQCPDSGATSHMNPHREWFLDYTPTRIPVRLADDSIIYSAGKGSMVFCPTIEGKATPPVIITDVLHVPHLANNLISVNYLSKCKGYRVINDGNKMIFNRGGVTLFTATITNSNLAYLDGFTSTNPENLIAKACSASTSKEISEDLLHRRLCHGSYGKVDQILKHDLIEGVRVKGKRQVKVCEPCIGGHQHRDSFPKESTTPTSGPLDLIITDVHELPVISHSGYRYWIVFCDAHTHMKHMSYLKKKSDALEAFRCYKAHVENELGCKIKIIRDDKGGEYMSHEFDKIRWDAGIFRQRTVRGSPQQTGMAE
jgi:hypothetical protein